MAAFETRALQEHGGQIAAPDEAKSQALDVFARPFATFVVFAIAVKLETRAVNGGVIFGVTSLGERLGSANHLIAIPCLDAHHAAQWVFERDFGARALDQGVAAHCDTAFK